MKNKTCFMVLFSICFFAGCQKSDSKPSWIRVVRLDPSVVQDEMSKNIDSGFLVEDSIWDDLDIEGADRPEEFLIILEKLPHGIDSRVDNDRQDSIFSYAVMLGVSRDCINFLVEQGAAVDQLNHLGDTPLHESVMRGDVEMVRILLDHGADPNSSDISGYTPLFKCAIYTKPDVLHEMYSLLIEYGANPHVYRSPIDTLDEQYTPYHCIRYRSEKRSDSEAALLLERMNVPPI